MFRPSNFAWVPLEDSVKLKNLLALILVSLSIVLVVAASQPLQARADDQSLPCQAMNPDSQPLQARADDQSLPCQAMNPDKGVPRGCVGVDCSDPANSDCGECNPYDDKARLICDLCPPINVPAPRPTATWWQGVTWASLAQVVR